MKKRNKLLALLVFFLLKFSVSYSQVDTVFWFAAPWVTPDHTFRDPVKVHIAGNPGTSVRVRQPAAIAPNKYDSTFTLGASGFQDYTFWRDAAASAINIGYDSLEVKPANTVLPYGLKISSTSNITVVYDVITRSPTFYNPETYSMKGQNGLGKEFVCPFQTKWNSVVLGGDVNGDGVVTQPRQQINIIASKPNTTVWITPKCGVVGHPANITYSVFLPFPGSAYTAQNLVANTTVLGNNLGGSIVTSNEDIAVTVSDDSVNGQTGCYDLMGDQIVPVDIVGKEYIVIKGKMNVGEPEGAFIVGTENFTQVNINDGVATSTIINKGETFHYPTNNQLTFISTNKNVYVLHGTGFGCKLGEALLPPMDCGGSNNIRFSRNNTQRYFLNILCKATIINNFILNGSPLLVPASAFTVVPGTGGIYVGAQIEYSLAQIPVSSATLSNLLSNTTSSTTVFSLGIYNGNVSTGNMYHYMSLFFRKTIITATTLTPICYGQTPTVALNGTISGGVTNGYWTVTSGTGSLSPINGTSATYTLAPGDAPLDTLRFTLISNKNCKGDTVLKTIKLKLNKPPAVSVGSGTLMCKNNLSLIPLTGTVTNGVGSWSGGNGGSFGPPGSNTTYSPSPADLAANTITLTLTGTSTVGCLPSVNSITIGFTNPPVVSAGPSTVVCTNSQSIALNGSITGYTLGSWNTTGTGGFFPGSSSPTGTYILSASDKTLNVITFSLTYTPVLPDNCSATTSTFQMSIIAKPLVVAPNDFTVCANGGAISLTGTVSGAATTGNWTTPNGTGVFNQNPPSGATYTMSQNDTLSGNVTFVLSSTGGICPSATDTLKVAILKAPVVTVNPNNLAVCRNAPITLTGNVAGYTNSGIWSSSGSGVFTPSNTSLGGQYLPSAGDVLNGSVILTLSSTNNQSCPAKSAFFTAIFVPSPKANFNLSAIRCQNSPIVFTDASQSNGTSNLSYNWSFGDGPGSISTGTNPIHTYTAAGSYVITFTVTGTSSLSVSCPDTTSRRISVYSTPTTDFTFLNACQGAATQFKDASTVLTGNVTNWNWQFGDGGSSIIRNPSHTFSTTGSYFVTLQSTSNYSCTSPSVSKLVTVNPKPKAEFGMTNNPSVAQEPVYFSDFSSPTGGITKWTWTFGDETSDNVPKPTHIYQNAGIFVITLTVFDANNCSDSISKSIEILLLPQVPTAFSPNNDNTNDFLFVKGGPFEGMKFRIYNNWGILLFETTDQKVGWDGKFNGIEQPVGSYVWTLEVDMYNNRQVKKNGDVTLIR